jgi:hypothetical protein
MTEDGNGRQEDDRGPRVLVKQSATDVGHHRVARPIPPATPASGLNTGNDSDAQGHRDQRSRHERHRRAHG